MNRKHATGFIVSATTILTLIAPVVQAGPTYKDGDKYAKIGGRIQLQYHRQDLDTGSSTDEVMDDLFFRRMRVYLEGSSHPDWKGKFQWDMGKAVGDNEIAIKDAYAQYKGFEHFNIAFGNANFPFSREFLTSSKYQNLIERTWVGDHDFGTPDRQLGVHLDGEKIGGKLEWAASLVDARLDPDSAKLDFDTAANDASDFNEGWMIGGRVEFQPMGKVEFSQGDFSGGELRASFGLGLFSWDNDDDNNTRIDLATGSDTSGGDKPDVDSVTGLELGVAIRGMGVSLDVQYNQFEAELMDGTVTAGMFKNGETSLKNSSIEGGYMVLANRVEGVIGYEMMDADNWSETWGRTSVGANLFFEQHDAKLQLTYRLGSDVNGVKGVDLNEWLLQSQFVF